VDELITQLGLLLTQTRFARRALEDIERATATYGTFAFTSVIAAGPKFGEPPLFDGALKVYVVNINDLAPGRGFGDFLQGLLGGVGSFVGNLGGGLIGGTISSVKLAWALPIIQNIAERVENILKLIGAGAVTPVKGTDGAAAAGPAEGSNLIGLLTSIKDAVQALTGLFLAAGGQPQLAAGMSSLPGTPEGERWQKLADSATVVLAGLARVVDGLVITLPLVLGSLAWFLSRLPDLRRAIAETLQFALRNMLLLRGALGVVAFDTLAMVARMGADLVRILAETVIGIIGVVADGVQEALLAVLHIGAVLGDVVKNTVDRLLNWLVPTVDAVLRNLGDLRVFRVITHVVRILPAIIEPIFELVKDRPVPNPTELHDAAKLTFFPPVGSAAGSRPGGAAAAAPPTLDTRPIFTDPALTADLTGSIGRIREVATNSVQLVGDTAVNGLRTVARRAEKGAVAETKLSTGSIGEHLAEVRKQSTSLAANLVVPEEAQRTGTGLDAIAGAYQSWLTGGGLNTLLGTITAHFSAEPGSAGVPQRLTEGAMDRPRANVQIDEVVIEVDPAAGVPPPPSPGGPAGPGDFPQPSERDEMERYGRMWFDYNLRGGGNRLPAIV
jgi:hypothetical protein